MLSTAYYFLQVIFCSAVMMGYYWLVLRDKKFHQYNRFYLLSVLVFSWIIPLIKIEFTKPVSSGTQVINFLSIVADNNAEMEANFAKNSYQFTWETFAIASYFLIAAIMLCVLIVGLVRLYLLLKKHSCKNLGEVYLILTQVKGTPFSFFRYIFWHEAIDLRSDTGKQMLEHELTHVQQKHSIDKLLIQVVLVAGWFNPFFWLLKKEMEMIHEFIADKKSVQNGDSAALANLLLTAAYPQHQFLLTTPFFFSPIKRRLQMITNNKNPRFSYLRRLIILPILAIVVVLFAFRKKEDAALPSLQLNKTYTIVIDAGHGGWDKGAVSIDNAVSESEIVLSIANEIRAANTNPNIKIVLTRETDVYNSVEEKSEFVNQKKADYFISLHVNASENKEESGITFMIPKNDQSQKFIRSGQLATNIALSMNGLSEKIHDIVSKENGVWLLKSANCPAVLLELGYMTNQNDLQKIKDPSFQKKVAVSILVGINSYLNGKEKNADKIVVDTVKLISNLILKDTNHPKITINGQIEPVGKTALFYLDGQKIDSISFHKINPNSIARVDVWKGEEAIQKYGEEGKNGVVFITSKSQTTALKLEKVSAVPVIGSNALQLIDPKAIYYIDGVKSDSTALRLLDPQSIEIINVWYGKDAKERFGKEAVNGVVDVKLKQKSISQ